MKKIIAALLMVLPSVTFCADDGARQAPQPTPTPPAAAPTASPSPSSAPQAPEQTKTKAADNAQKQQSAQSTAAPTQSPSPSSNKIVFLEADAAQQFLEKLAGEQDAKYQDLVLHLHQENAALHQQQEKEQRLTTQLEMLPKKTINRVPKAIIEGVVHGISSHYVAPKIATTLTHLDQTFMPTITAPILDWLKPKPTPLSPEEQKKYNIRKNAALAVQNAQARHEILKAEHEQYEHKMAALSKVLEYKRRLIARTTETEEKKKLEAEIKAYEAAEANMVLHLEIALDNDIEAHRVALQLNHHAASAG